MNFESWLFKQKDRDDPIGDLAKDWIADGKPKPFNYKYLCAQYHVPLEVKATYYEAKAEYLRNKIYPSMLK